jgi:hypothetical protein
VSKQTYSLETDPMPLVSAVLVAISRALPDEQRRRIASELRQYAERVNEDAESEGEQRFALSVASLAALAEDGPSAASDILRAGQPR